MAIKRKEKTYTDAIQMRSLRADQAAFRRSAADSAAGTGSRRFASNNTIKAAKARTVTKKNRSLRTIGPIKAISRLDEGITPLSDSSCNPEISNCAATRNRIAV